MVTIDRISPITRGFLIVVAKASSKWPCAILENQVKDLSANPIHEKATQDEIEAFEKALDIAELGTGVDHA